MDGLVRACMADITPEPEPSFVPECRPPIGRHRYYVYRQTEPLSTGL